MAENPTRARGPRLLAKAGACLLLAWHGVAGGAELVLDINQGGGIPRFTPLGSVDLPGVTLFSWDDGVRGEELWATDGTPSGTRFLRDINPGPAGSGIHGMVAAGGMGYFWANDGTNGMELWRSDGTAAGTRMVANIFPEMGGLPPEDIRRMPPVALGNLVYFPAYDAQHGTELWRSDGTTAGTIRLTDITPGPGDSEPRSLIAFDGRLFFNAMQGGTESLWSVSGTPGSLQRIARLSIGATLGTRKPYAIAGGTLFLAASSENHGRELWRIAAGSSAAELVRDFMPGSAHSNPRGLFPFRDGVIFGTLTPPSSGPFEEGRLFFARANGTVMDLGEMPCDWAEPAGVASLAERAVFLYMLSGCRIPRNTDLYTTDGTAAGTHPLSEDVWLFLDGPSVVMPGDYALLFGYGNPPPIISRGAPTTLWRTDGTAAGTMAIGNFGQNVVPQSLLAIGSQAFFNPGLVGHPGNGELWLSDGTQAGTRMVTQLRGGAGIGARVDQLREARGSLLFTADDGLHGNEPWVSDGSTAGTRMLGDLRQETGVEGSDPLPQLALGELLLFTADDGVHGRELWASDGSAGGTRMMRDINPGPGSSTPTWFVDMGGFALFQADDGVSGRELWRTDGTAAGTYQVADLLPGPGHADPIMTSFGAEKLDGIAYFMARNAQGISELWRSDGTAGGTWHVPGPQPNGGLLGVVGNRVLFPAWSGDVVRLWGTDGTPDGTQVVTDAVTFQAAHVQYRGHIYFAGEIAEGETQLWRTDGTAAGTRPVTIAGQHPLRWPNRLAANERVLALVACTEPDGCGMYVSDGSAAGLRRAPGEFFPLAASDGERLFYVDYGTEPNRMMVTDGTPAGTRPLIAAGRHASGRFAGLTWFGGSLAYVAWDAEVGPSVWSVTAAGDRLQLLADPDPATGADWFPGPFLSAGPRLFFNAHHPAVGRELWVIDERRPNANDDRVSTAFDTPVRIAVLANDSTLSGTLDPASLEILDGPSLGSATIDGATGEVDYVPNTGSDGQDSFTYRVRNTSGYWSNVATVAVTVSARATPPPPPSPPPGGGNGGSGGGGGLGLGGLLALAAMVAGARRRLGGTSDPTPGPAASAPPRRLQPRG